MPEYEKAPHCAGLFFAQVERCWNPSQPVSMIASSDAIDSSVSLSASACRTRLRSSCARCFRSPSFTSSDNLAIE